MAFVHMQREAAVEFAARAPAQMLVEFNSPLNCA
jgi:hypothetical protein